MSKAKIIDKRSEENIVGEKNILSKIRHPFIVNMHFSFQDSDNLYLIIDYLSGGDLRYHLSHKKSSLFNENQTKFFISNIIIALEYIHSQKIIHRDIKPENLILDNNGYLRITDFGIAVYNKKENIKESNGTAGYVAPEVLLQEGYNYSSDFFALGIIGYECMQGHRPYFTQNRKKIKDLILSYQPKIKTNQMKKGWSEKSRDFINKLLQRKPIKRLGYTGIKELKNHIWMRDINWDLLKKKKIKSPYIPKEGKEYFDKKYCVISKAHENNKLINVNGYQHVFEKYTYINLSYVSKFVNIQKENNKMEKDKENERQKSFSESSKDKKVDMHKNKSTSLIKLSKKNYYINNIKKKKEQEEGKNNKLKIFRNNSNINHQFKENYSSYDNKENLYNQNNNLRRFYDLGIEKNKNKLNKDKNNSCRLFISKEKEKEKNKNNLKDNKKFEKLKLINKYSKNNSFGISNKNSNKIKSKKIIFNYDNKNVSNNEKAQIVYSTTKKTTKEKTNNTLSENQKNDEIKKSSMKLNNINYEKNHLNKNNLKYSQKKYINDFKSSKYNHSKSQNINIKGIHKSSKLSENLSGKNNSVNKNRLNNIKNYSYTRKKNSNINNKKNKSYISISIQNNHFKFSNTLSKNKNNNTSCIFSSKHQKISKKINMEKIIKKRKKSFNNSNKLKPLKFDDYFRYTGLLKESTKNNFYILDKFKSII